MGGGELQGVTLRQKALFSSVSSTKREEESKNWRDLVDFSLCALITGLSSDRSAPESWKLEGGGLKERLQPHHSLSPFGLRKHTTGANTGERVLTGSDWHQNHHRSRPKKTSESGSSCSVTIAIKLRQINRNHLVRLPPPMEGKQRFDTARTRQMSSLPCTFAPPLPPYRDLQRPPGPPDEPAG